MIVSTCSSALLTSTARKWWTFSIISAKCSFKYKCMSVATWSFLLRAVWSLPATGPISSWSIFSKFKWMSSFSIVKVNSFFAAFSANIVNPAVICCASSLVMIPVSPSILTWAKLPVMSCVANCWSKGMEAPNASIQASFLPSKRPPQSFAIIVVLAFLL